MDANAIGALSGLGAAALGAAAAVGRMLYGKFKRSGSREIESFAQYAVQGIKYYIGRYVRHRLASEFTLRQYAKLQLQSTAREMFVPAAIPVRLNVDQSFIPLLLGDSLQERIEYSDLLDRTGDRLMVLGEPGSGKSSLFKRIFRDACRSAASSPRKTPVPVLFELRNLTADEKTKKAFTGDDLLNIILADLRNSAVYRAAKGIEDLQRGAGFLILMDGLDEVPDTLSKSAVKAILDMCHTLKQTSPKSTVLLSSRSQYFFSRYGRDLQESFDVLSVRPFTAGDVYNFLTKWTYVDKPGENVTRIFSRIRQLPSLAEMCTNPLALSMFVARDQQTGGSDLPETRSRFYESLIEELIINRRSRGEGLPAGRQRLRDARRAILGRVCIDHILDREEALNSIPRARFLGAIKEMKYGGRDSVKALLDLSSDTGLFSAERSGETERFIHLTLCEFMAAVEVVETGEAGWERLLSSFGDDARFWESRLAEVVAFACGLAGRALRRRILDDLARIDAPQVMLKAIIEAQAYDDEAARRAINSECQSIAGQSPDEWNTRWYSRLRIVLGALRDSHAGQSAAFDSTYAAPLQTSSDFLMSLMERYRAEAALLETLARQDADAAIVIASETRRRDLMNHVASAADDIVVLQGILSKCDAGDGAWRAALCQRALVDRRVARSLLSESEKIWQGEYLSSGWMASPLLRNSYYGSLLDGFLADKESWGDALDPLLTGLSKLAVPSLRRLIFSRPSIVIALSPFALIFGFDVFLLCGYLVTFYPGKGILVPSSILIVFTVISITGYSAIRWIATSRIHRRVRRVRAEITSEGEVKAGQGRYRDGRTPNAGRIMGTGAYITINRLSVLIEILNIAAYKFRGLEEPGRLARFNTACARIKSGTPLKEMRLLAEARQLRASTPFTDGESDSRTPV
jgi:hypothetical protein